MEIKEWNKIHRNILIKNIKNGVKNDLVIKNKRRAQ